MRFLLIFCFLVCIVSIAKSQPIEQVKVEVIGIKNLPVQLKEANFNNLEYRADFDYSVTNLTDNKIWNFEIALYFLDSKGLKISKKLEVCLDYLIKPNFGKCRYVPPGTSIEPQKTEEFGVIFDERVKSGTKVFAIIKEVRGEKGIWQVNDKDMRNTVLAYIGKKKYQPAIKKTNHIILTDSDRLAVIKPTLEKALIKKQIPDYNLLKDKNNIVVSTENIPTQFSPKLSRIKLNFLSPDKIKEKADLDDDFLYLTFADIASNGDKIFVVLINSWVKNKDSKKMYLSGGGMFLEFRKIKGKWIGEIVGGWIS